MIRWFTDLLYLVPLRRRSFAIAHPGATILCATATKAVHSLEPLPHERGWHWVVARRAALLLTSELLVCGDWTIPLSEVRSARFHTFAGAFRSTGGILSIEAASGHYQFGLQTSDLVDALPIPCERTEGPLAMSTSSIVLRAVLLLLLFAISFGLCSVQAVGDLTR